MYMSAFHKCDKYFWWEPWGNVGASIPYSLEFMTTNFQKPKFDALALDVFNSIAREPWTLALRGKVLIISPFAESFKEKVDVRAEIYGIDLFPDCELSFIKPPQTQGDNHTSLTWKSVCGLLMLPCVLVVATAAWFVRNMGKSAIYIGGVGILAHMESDGWRPYLYEGTTSLSGFEKVEDMLFSAGNTPINM